MRAELRQRLQDGAVSVLTLITSGGTLICCALPIMLVSVGLGAAVVGLTSALPWLVTLSEHKEWVFAGSALLLAIGGWTIYRPGRRCPADPELQRLCESADRWNRRVFWLSVSIWGIGFAAAYLSLPILRLLEGAP